MVPRLLGWERRPAARAHGRAARPGGPRPGALPRPLPEPAVGRRAPARRRRPCARRRPAGDAHGRAVRGRRPDRPRPTAERVPAAPGRARQDDPVRDPRHRRGDQDGRPRRGHAGRRPARPVRQPRRDPCHPGVRLRRPLRRRGPRAQAAVARPGQRPRPRCADHRPPWRRRRGRPTTARGRSVPLPADRRRRRSTDRLGGRATLRADGPLSADLASPMSPAARAAHDAEGRAVNAARRRRPGRDRHRRQRPHAGDRDPRPDHRRAARRGPHPSREPGRPRGDRLGLARSITCPRSWRAPCSTSTCQPSRSRSGSRSRLLSPSSPCAGAGGLRHRSPPWPESCTRSRAWRSSRPSSPSRGSRS